MMNKDNRNDKIRKIAKKGLTFSLCAVLAGGLAAGSFEGVNKLAGWSGATTVEAASNKDETTLTYAKSEKKDADTSDSKSDTGKDTGSIAKGSLDVSEIVSEALPSIVSITTKSVQEVQNYFGMYGMYGYAPQQQEQEVEGSGSGIIVGKNDDELLIATNYHVVEGAETLSVGFCDSTACEAKVKGYDSERDLAVVAVSLDDIDSDTMDAITIATIGNSDDLKVGAQVVAIGNALGYGQSVTTGIVSAKNRQLNSDDTVGDYDSDSNSATNLIQTDAAINPGNSGGALLNMNGEVVGINSAKLASTAVEGIGYAIAISDVTDTLESLMNEETREKVAQAEKSGSFRAKSSSELKKRQAILAAKQSIIGNMLDKAYDAMVALPDEEYFQVIVKCLEKSVQPKSGEICFSGKDRKRLTPQTEKQIEQIAAAHGGSLKVSNGNCDIDGGFILIYGGIEENCSFRAMLDANREHLADKVNELLFVDNR